METVRKGAKENKQNETASFFFSMREGYNNDKVVACSIV